MADLQDFFAKKDKKKKGKGKKYVATSPAVMAKALEKSSAPPPNEVEKKPVEFKIDLPSSTAADDEWHDVEEKTRDLEGLKIRSLKIDETEEVVEKPGEKQGGVQSEEDSDVDEPSESGTQSAWQPILPQPEPVVEVVPDIPPANEIKKTGVYVPPSRRNQSGERGGTAGSGPHKWKKNAPPDINNSIAFPSLSSGAGDKP